VNTRDDYTRWTPATEHLAVAHFRNETAWRVIDMGTDQTIGWPCRTMREAVAYALTREATTYTVSLPSPDADERTESEPGNATR